VEKRKKKMTSIFQNIINLFRRNDTGYVSYYHFVVATVPDYTKQPYSDRLLIAAFEDVCRPESGLWQRNDDTPAELRIQCARALPFYQLAKQRSEIRAVDDREGDPK
jgi:hypothetical protein